MSQRSNHFLLGLFVLLGTGLVLAFCLVLGSRTLFQEQVLFETYVDQSVQGLEVGSAVKLRGVTVGVVRDMEFTLDLPNRQITHDNTFVRIVMALSTDSFALGGKTIEEVIEVEVERGLRARLANVGLTGSSYMELDYLDPEVHPPLEMDWVTRNPYIPSAKASFARIIDATEEVIVKIRDIDFESISDNLDSLVSTAVHRLEEADIGSVITNVYELTSELRETNRRFQDAIASVSLGELSADARETIARLDRILDSPELVGTIARFHSVIVRVDDWLEHNQEDLADTAGMLRETLDNLRDLTREVSRYPSRFLFGEPPPRLPWNP